MSKAAEPEVIERIGEVISSSTTEFLAQCLRRDRDGLTLPQAPPFGNFVRVASEELGFETVGIVYNAETSSIDGVHRPMAMNMTRQELREQQPQIFDLIKTDFSVIVIGFREGHRFHQFLPPHPPQIHDFVYSLRKDEVAQLTDELVFLRTLLNAPNAPSDELIASCLRVAYQAHLRDRDFLLRAGRQLSNLLKDNYDRLSAILQRLSP